MKNVALLILDRLIDTGRIGLFFAGLVVLAAVCFAFLICVGHLIQYLKP